MQNLQNIPSETDIDKPMPDDRSKYDEEQRPDIPLPKDRLPAAPVSEPPTNQKPMIEPNSEPPRLMKFYTATQRRIF